MDLTRRQFLGFLGASFATGLVPAITLAPEPELEIISHSNARIIAKYRGRVVLSGLTSPPDNWYTSRVGDPFDWHVDQS